MSDVSYKSIKEVWVWLENEARLCHIFDEQETAERLHNYSLLVQELWEES